MVGPGRPRALTAEEEAELEALLHVRLLPRIGDRVADVLLRQCGTARAVLEAPDEEFRRLAGPAALESRARGGARAVREARAILEGAWERGIHVLGRGLPGYPPRLLHLADPPPVLFVRGRKELLEGERVAVVGTRRATGAGRRFATRLGRVVSGARITLVSGLALGIDGAAHRGALEGPGSTIAVLGTGLDGSHPRSHARLQARIAEEGLLVSEFPPGEKAAPHHFPRRNRIIAGLSRALVVVEAGARSGALITVDHALDLGIDVFAVPGSIEYEQSKGTNGLLRDGARVLVRPEELLAAWDVPVQGSEHSPTGDGLSDPEGILPLLGPRPRPTDELSRLLGRPPALVLRALSELELVGAAIRDDGGWRASRPEDDPDPEPRSFPRGG